jgi:hypothetical protein
MVLTPQRHAVESLFPHAEPYPFRRRGVESNLFMFPSGSRAHFLGLSDNMGMSHVGKVMVFGHDHPKHGEAPEPITADDDIHFCVVLGKNDAKQETVTLATVRFGGEYATLIETTYSASFTVRPVQITGKLAVALAGH